MNSTRLKSNSHIFFHLMFHCCFSTTMKNGLWIAKMDRYFLFLLSVQPKLSVQINSSCSKTVAKNDIFVLDNFSLKFLGQTVRRSFQMSDLKKWSAGRLEMY